jgi:hypothetical protein
MKTRWMAGATAGLSSGAVRAWNAVLLFAIKRPSSDRITLHLELTAPDALHSLTIRQWPGVEMFRFCQDGSGYDRNLTDRRSIAAAIEYIHLHPVRRGLCERAIDWKWSSARSLLLPVLPSDLVLPHLTPVPTDLL